MNRWSRALFVAALSASLAACASNGEAGAAPTTTPTERIAIVADSSPFQAGPKIPGLMFPGVTFEHEASESENDLYFLRWPVVPRATALNEAAAKAARAQLARFREDNPPEARGDAELHVDGQIVAAAGNVAAVRFTHLVPTGAKGQINHETLYGDAGGTWSATSADLIEPGKRAEFGAAAVAAAKPSLPADSTTMPAPDAKAVLTDLTVTPGGGLRVVIDQGVIAAATDGTGWAELPAATVAPYLSERGREVVAELTSGRPYAGRYTAPEAPTVSGAPPATTSAAPSSPGTAAGGDAVDCATRKCVALTYDDGPGPYTAKLLDELTAAKVPATLFMLGQNAQAHPDVVRRAAETGQVVANHTWDHRDLARLDTATARWEIDTTAELLRRLSGQPVNLLRPPYGSYQPATAALGWPLVLWSVDTEDWKNRDVATTTQRAVSGARPGAIILLHDIHPSSVAATPGIISALQGQGYTFVTVPQLLGATAAGKIYTSR